MASSSIRRSLVPFVVAALALAGLASGCASSRYETSSHFDTEYDFAKVKTFAFRVQREKSAESAGGHALEDALRRNLVARGYVEAPAESADVHISYDLGRYAPSKLSGANAFAQTDGTLSVTVIDRATGATVWYGWVETRLRPHDDLSIVGGAVDALFEDRVPRVGS